MTKSVIKSIFGGGKSAPKIKAEPIPTKANPAVQDAADTVRKSTGIGGSSDTLLTSGQGSDESNTYTKNRKLGI